MRGEPRLTEMAAVVTAALVSLLHEAHQHSSDITVTVTQANRLWDVKYWSAEAMNG